MARWKAWYTDGSAFSDQDGEPWQAPRLGVQLVVTKWPDARSARSLLLPVDPENAKEPFAFGRSYYCWYDRGFWLNHDLTAMVRVYLPQEQRPVVLLGEYISQNAFNNIRQAAGNDPYTRLIAEG